MAKFKPRARIIRTIGDQLISGPEAALIELVKNSYDAEAEWVKISFFKKRDNHYAIIVEDNGHGMRYQEVIDNWLEPATGSKAKNTLSKNNRRTMLGAKGIGRFAVSRLGKISVISTVSDSSTKKEKEKTNLMIDWSVFTADEYLENIEIDLEREIVSKEHRSGFKVEIDDLRDVWTKKQLEKLILELRRLAYPREDDEFKLYLDIGCFEKKSAGFDGAELFEENNSGGVIFDSPSGSLECQINPFLIGEIADYKLSGRFDERGDFDGVFQLQRGDSEKHRIVVRAPIKYDDEESCGPVEIKLNVYDREHDAVKKVFERMGFNFEKIGIRQARKILTDISGISILRNGFRIRPYGSPDHDWLELQSKRVQDPSKKLGSDQVSGQVIIEDEHLSGIVERSSREGLEINSSYRRLKSLITNLLPHIEERRYDFRGKAGLGRKTSTNVEKVRGAASLARTARALDKVPKKYRNEVANAIKRDSEDLNAMLDEVDNYQKILQSRASLGLVVAEVIHEGRRLLDPMMASSDTLKADWEHAFEDSRMGEIFRNNFPEDINVIHNGGRGLSKLFKKLDPVSGRRRGRPTSFYVAAVVKDVLDIMSYSIESAEIEINVKCESWISCVGYKEDLQAGLLNIIENAIHWLSVSDIKRKEIVLDVGVDSKKVILSISNNGPEIDEAYVGRLFDAGFSLRSDGTGLGLAIAREACRASKGDLKYSDFSNYTTFIIEFPEG